MNILFGRRSRKEEQGMRRRGTRREGQQVQRKT